jgi:hypothetical protein
VLEAVASYDLWIWHFFFGLPGSHNDINILDQSPLFRNMLNGVAPTCSYQINGKTFLQGYYLSDGIYPDWATLIKTISHPQGAKKEVRTFLMWDMRSMTNGFYDTAFAKMQEAARKDVERAFGVLQAWFAIIARPACGWSHENLHKIIMKCCVILHNMIIKDERASGNDDFNYDLEAMVIPPNPHRSAGFSQFVSNFRNIQDTTLHFEIRDNLIKHLWNLKGQSEE